MDVSQTWLAAVEYGPYINPFKILPVLVVLLIWGRLMTWANKDAEDAHLPGAALNTTFLVGLVFAFFLFLTLPSFVVALSVFIFIMIAEMGIYLALRSQKVGLSDLGKQFNNWIGGFKKGKKQAKASEGEIVLMNKKGSPIPPPEDEAPERAGFDAIQTLLSDPLRRGAERVEMKPTEASASVKYLVDGVALDGRSVPKEDANGAVTMLKQLAGLDLNDRRKPQTGPMKATMDGKKHDLVVHTAGTTAGESVAIDIDPKKRFELTIDQLGFTDDQLNRVEEVVGEGMGIVLLAAPKGNGLTSLLYGVLRRHDAFLSHIQTIEREPRVDLEGITQNKLAGTAEEAKQANWVASQEPDILMIDKVEDPATAAELIRFAGSGKRVYVGIRAGSTFEALRIWRTLVGDEKLAMKSLSLVVAGRLVRKLCAACKMDYNPDPDTLKKLNMPPERVGKLFTARNQPLRDGRGREIVCTYCLDLRFKGRTGVFEMFTIDDEVRNVVSAGGSDNQLKMLFKKQRQKYMQEHALAKAVSGDTSLQEIARVMRASEAPPSKPPPSAPSSPARKR